MKLPTKQYFHLSCLFAVTLAILLISAIIMADKLSADLSNTIIKQQLAQVHHMNKPIGPHQAQGQA